jgi:hypothetical protein
MIISEGTMQAAHALRPPELEGIDVPAFLCRADAGVVAANGPAGALLASWVAAPFDRPAGELLACLNARDAGCGRGPRCATCPVRAAIRRALTGERVRRVAVAMELVRDGIPRRVELRVSASLAEAPEPGMVLLTLEPAEWVR